MRFARRTPLAAPALVALAWFAGRAAAEPAHPGSPHAPIVVDAFESAAAWAPMPASGVEMQLASEPGPRGHVLRIDFDFHGGGGYAVLHRKLSLDLPPNYRFEFRIRGETPPQNLEFKLLDESGENVWWCNRVNYEYPRQWTTERIRKRQISFAWGPQGGGELRRVAAIEFAVTAGSGGRGTVWLDDLMLVPMPVPGVPPPPVAGASSAGRGHEPALAADTLADTWWESLPADRLPTWTLDLGTTREFGGLVLDWVGGRHARDYDIEFDDGAGLWRVAREVRASDGGRDWLDLPESETRRVRIRTLARAGATVALAGVRVMPLEWAATPQSFLMAVAKDSPRGHYPRAFLGEQVYWTVVGADGDTDEGLLDEDGRLEVGRSRFSLEPFLLTERGLRTWADGTTSQSLPAGSLPIPTASWLVDSLELSVTVFARTNDTGVPLFARYRVRNPGPRARNVSLFVAVRPIPVNPPSQTLNSTGALPRVESLRLVRNILAVNANDRWVQVTPAPVGLCAMTLDQGDFVASLPRLPPETRTRMDPLGRISGALRWDLVIPAAGSSEVDVETYPALQVKPDPEYLQFRTQDVDRWQYEVEDEWSQALGTLDFTAGGPGAEVAATLRAQLGYVLVNRDGPAIQPGSRAYERSWIRDGALTSSALLRAGMVQPVREYLTWYADHQYADGKVPCCVDKRGADPVPEHDSHGELVFLAAEYLRLTGDRATAERVYPHVRAAVAYLDTLRAQRRTPAWRTRENAPYYGLLPPSISHEGYSAKPMHSYWDDLFALRGFKDGAWLAGELGHALDARWMGASREEFARDFSAAAAAAMKAHAIDYVPGCSDLGDFDATSTTIALAPVQADGVLPEPALRATFERYWKFFQDRKHGREPWEAFTPYELRNVGAFVRLGWRDRADSLLDWFMGFRRPAGWKQWAEVVDHDPRHARFIGDMPHTWVGTDFVRSVLDMLAYERERDSALVIAAGVPASWLGDSGVAVRGLRTRWGTLGYRLTGPSVPPVLRSGTLAFDSTDLRVPRGGIVLDLPALVPGTNDVQVTLADGSTRRVTVPTGPFRWQPERAGAPLPRRIHWAPHRFPDEPIRNLYR